MKNLIIAALALVAIAFAIVPAQAETVTVLPTVTIVGTPFVQPETAAVAPPETDFALVFKAASGIKTSPKKAHAAKAPAVRHCRVLELEQGGSPDAPSYRVCE